MEEWRLVMTVYKREAQISSHLLGASTVLGVSAKGVGPQRDEKMSNYIANKKARKRNVGSPYNDTEGGATWRLPWQP
jgi:hypothetical protein